MADLDKVWRTKIRPTMNAAPVLLPSRHVEAADAAATLPDHIVFRLGYVPFVVAEVVWDYIDSFVNAAAAGHRQEIKRTCRVLRSLRRDYQKYRSQWMNKQYLEGEEHNMLVFEDEARSVFNGYFLSMPNGICPDVRKALDQEDIYLLQAAHGCILTMIALERFVDKVCSEAEAACGEPWPNPIPTQTLMAVKAVMGCVGYIPFFKSFRKTKEMAIAHLLALMDGITCTPSTRMTVAQ